MEKEILKSKSVYDLISERNRMLELLKELNSDKGELSKFYRFIYLYNAPKNSFGTRLNIDQSNMIHFIDRYYWGELLNSLPFFDIMSPSRKKQWLEMVNNRNSSYPVLEFTSENISNQINELQFNKRELFLEKIEELFLALSFDYKTNNPVAFGKKFIFQLYWINDSNSCYHLDCLDDVLRVLDKKHNRPLEEKPSKVIGYSYKEGIYEFDYYGIRVYKNGNAHVTFHNLYILEELNGYLSLIMKDRLPNLNRMGK